MSAIEIAAAGFGLASVILTVRQSMWCWPTGLVMVVLYIFVFHNAQLYSDMALQVVYIFLQIYGWYHWGWYHWGWYHRLHGGAERAVLPVTRIGGLRAVAWGAAAAAGIAGLGWTMATRTDAALPFWDAATTVLSLVAQWFLAKKYLESWVVWIIVDILAVGIYWSRELYVTTGLYAVFLVLAVTGLLAWRAQLTPSKR